MILSEVQISSVLAQSRFAVGIEGGPSYTYIYGNSTSTDNIKPILGGFGGINFQYGFSKHFALKVGIAYERKGSDLVVNSSFRLNYTFHFDYITLPLLIKARYGKKVRFIASAGPYISYLIKQTYINNNYTPITSEYPLPDKATYDNKKNYDLGVIGCIGIEVSIAKQFSLSLEVRDHYGLVNTQLFPVFVARDGTQYNNDRKSSNNSAILSLGFSYFFGPGKEY